MIGQTQCKTCKKFKLGFAEWGRERKEETKTEGGGLREELRKKTSKNRKIKEGVERLTLEVV